MDTNKSTGAEDTPIQPFSQAKIDRYIRSGLQILECFHTPASELMGVFYEANRNHKSF